MATGSSREDQGLFRKAALDRLSSPEQLDSLIEVTTLRAWLALLGLLSLVATGLAWGFLGRLPTQVTGTGVLLGSGGIATVVTLGGGVIAEVTVEVGDEVRAGDVVARIAQPELAEKIASAKAQLAEVRSA